MSRRALQVVSGLLSVIPIVTGGLTMMGLRDPIYAAAGLPENALLDSNLRFLGGLWLVAGLAMLWLIPRIERETALFRVLWLMIFAGGVGRLLSMGFVGAPPAPFIGFTLLEIVGAPLFIAWQAQLARGAAPAHATLASAENARPAAAATSPPAPHAPLLRDIP